MDLLTFSRQKITPTDAPATATPAPVDAPQPSPAAFIPGQTYAYNGRVYCADPLPQNRWFLRDANRSWRANGNGVNYGYIVNAEGHVFYAEYQWEGSTRTIIVPATRQTLMTISSFVPCTITIQKISLSWK